MLPHAEIIVGTPDGHILTVTLSIVANGLGKLPALTLYVGKNPVAAFLMEPIKLAFEETLEIHSSSPEPGRLLDPNMPGVNPKRVFAWPPAANGPFF